MCYYKKQFNYFAQVKEDEEKRKAILKINDNTSILLLRYGVVRKNIEADFSHYSHSSSNGKYLSLTNAAKLPEGYAYAAFPLRGGFVYVYYETDQKWAEFKVEDALRLRNIVWSKEDNNGKNRIPKTNEYYTGLPVGKNKAIWIACSEVQWAPGYAVKVLTTEALRKGRMQKIDIGKWNSGQKQESTFRLSDLSIFGYQSNKSANGDMGEIEQLKCKVENTLKLKDEEEHLSNIFFVLNDPLGAADDLMSLLNKEYDYLDALAACATTGRDPRYMKKNSEGQFGSSLDEVKQEEYNAAFSTGLTLYMSLYNKSLLSAEKSSELEKYRKKLDLGKITAMLGVQKRAAQRGVIHKVRDALGAMLQSNYYQNILFDYSENSDSRRLEGEARITALHFGVLSDLPHYHDQHLDLYKKRDEDKWRKFIVESFSGEGVSNIQGLMSSSWQYKLQSEPLQTVSYRLYFKTYDAASVFSTAVDKVEELLGGLSTALSLYGPYVGTKLKKTKLLEKVNKLKIDNQNLVAERETTLRELNKELESQIKNIQSKRARIRKKRRKELSAENQAKVEKAMKGLAAQLREVDLQIGNTKVKVFGFLHERAKFASTNHKAVAALGRFLVAVDIVNVGCAMHDMLKNDSSKNKFNFLAASMALTSSALSLSTLSMRMLDLKITRFLFKNVSIRFSVRLAWGAGIAGAIADGFSAYERFQSSDIDAAVCYALAATAGAGMITGYVASTVFSLAWGGPVAWVCLAVGFFIGGLAYLLTDDDFELYLEYSIFSKDVNPKKIPSSLFPNAVVGLLYTYKNELKKNLTLSGVLIDMSSFYNMEGWLRNLFFWKEDSCKFDRCVLHEEVKPNELGLGSDFCLDYLWDRLRFSCSFSISRPISVGVKCTLYLYLDIINRESEMLKIAPLSIPTLSKDPTKELCTFSANYPEVRQDIRKLIMDKEWKSDRPWYELLDRSRSGYIFSYRLYTNLDEEQYMPFDQEYYVMGLPFVGYQRSAKRSPSYDFTKLLKPIPLKEFNKLLSKHILIDL